MLEGILLTKGELITQLIKEKGQLAKRYVMSIQLMHKFIFPKKNYRGIDIIIIHEKNQSHR